ncbi:hypothetical protein [Mucilaginibacter sp.]|uniref:hypothetical protein n=1 Tax=Mucilaginibacter sp. TaxID=1882438 RepID=UPI003D12BFD1
MQPFYKLLILGFLCPFFSFAQSNYKPGQAVTLKGDTLRGYIDYREWDVSPVSISFKNNLSDSKVQKLTVDDINSFSIGTFETYQKYTGPISTDVTNIARIGTGKDSSYRVASVFFKVLQKGNNVSLFSYTDNIKTRFYIEDSQTNLPVELIYRVYYNSGTLLQNESRTVNENTYLKQLFALAIKYNVLDDNLSRTFEKSDYSASDILYIVSKINNYKADKKSGGKSSFEFMVGAGINASATGPSSGSAYEAAGAKHYTSYLPKALFALNAYANPNTKRIIFRAELSVGGSHYESLYNNQVYPYILINYSFTQINISLTPQVIYNIYNADKLKFFIGAGLALNYSEYTAEVFKANDGSNTKLTSAYPFYFFHNTDQILLKAGVMVNKRFEIYANYLNSVLISEDAFFQLNEKQIQVGLAYLLGK